MPSSTTPESATESRSCVKTVDGLPQLFAVNTLAPYILTALITMPKRLVYLSSGMHYGAGSHLDDMLWEKRRWNGSQAYAETKFQDVLLAFAVARLFPGVKSNSLEPGWVPTKMGGAGCARRYRQGASDAGLAGDERRTGRDSFRKVFLSPEASGSGSDYKKCRTTEVCCSTCVKRFQGRLFLNRSLFPDPGR